MQLSLAAALSVAAILALPHAVQADGELSLRGAYYKERATRVQQPMIDGRFDAGETGEVRVHALVDAITSASVAAGAAGEPFTEVRWEGGAGYLRELDTPVAPLRLGVQGRYSNEPDYVSFFGGVRAELDLAQRNTTVGLAFNYGHDQLNNAGSQGGISQIIEGTLDTVMGSASISQLLSPTVVVKATYDLIYLDGFQQNPYRSVVAGGVVERERVPDTRLRHAVAASTRGHLPGSGTTLVANYRLYLDDWGIVAHTPEVRAIQSLPREAELALRFRYHRQSRAEFFRTVYDTNDPTMQPFLTDDVKLSAFDGQTYGTRLEAPLSALGVRGERADIRASASFEYVVQNNRFGDAVIAEFAITVPFAY
ncbi:MAG TPA: DUF3570 domain-containing protein [Kofleriaceae bacterium]|nr:DUF3570 domain-containing protein [Kofleriaceae bacterium]